MNTAFLDKLEGRGRASENDVMRERVQEEERPRLASEDFRSQQPYATTEQVHLAHLNPDAEQSCSDWTEDGECWMDVWISLCLLFLTPFFSPAQCWLTKPKSDVTRVAHLILYERTVIVCLVCVKSKALHTSEMLYVDREVCLVCSDTVVPAI